MEIDEPNDVGIEEVQPTAETTDSSAEEISENPSAPEASKGFGSAFSNARQKITAEETASEEPDEKPATEDEPEDAPESDEEKGDDPDKSSEPEDKTSRRGMNYKQAISENERLTTENAAITERVEKLDKQFEKYGGTEIVTEAMEIFENLSNGNVMEVLKGLPKPAQTKVQQDIFNQALGAEANRIYGVNHILTTDFGLKKPLDQSTAEKVFEYIAYSLNEDGDEFIGTVDRMLEYANTPERENERLKAELEKVKNGKPETAKEPGEKSPEESQIEFTQRIEKTLVDFEDSTFAKISDTELKSFGLAPTDTDTPSVRQAKIDLADALRSSVGEKMRGSKAFEPLLPFWAENDTDNNWYRQAAKAYERAATAQCQKLLKSISKLVGIRQEKKTPVVPTNNQIPATTGKTSIQTNKKPATGGGFGSAFKDAKKNVGFNG